MLCKVPYINQMPAWPTGCESVSTVMLLQYLQLDIGVEEFISFLPRKALTQRDGKTLGADPDRYFIGSPYDADSFGCYAGVIVDTVNRIAAQKRLSIRAREVSALSTPQLVQTYLAAGMPVLYWATIDLLPSYPGPEWQIEGTDNRFCWLSNEHCMLLVGAEQGNYIFNDPWNGHGVISYPKALAEQRHREMRSMAVVIEKTAEIPDDFCRNPDGL